MMCWPSGHPSLGAEFVEQSIGLPEGYQTLRVLDMGCVERELRRWLQTMGKMYPLVVETSDHAEYDLPSGGRLRIAFKDLPPRVIALVRLSRMEVVLAFGPQALPDEAAEFLKTFMLYTQRGGG